MKSGTSLWATLGLCLVFASCGGMGNEQPGQEDPPQGQEMPEPLPGLEQEAPGGAAGGRYGGRSSERTRSRAAEASKAIQLGLAWLAQHQDENGRWSAAQFMKNSPKTSEPCTGPGRAMHDVGATGLALLAYLGDGNTLRVGPYREQVKKGVAWLRQQQQESGLIGESSGHAYMYNHGIATTAMVEAYGLSQYPLLKKNAQRALDYIAKARNPYKVWRYYPQDGQNDTSVTTWMVLALCAGRDFELSIDKDALKFAEAWFQEVTDPKTGQAGYTKRGEPSSRIAGDGAALSAGPYGGSDRRRALCEDTPRTDARDGSGPDVCGRQHADEAPGLRRREGQH
jgi:hypothetical protein